MPPEHEHKSHEVFFTMVRIKLRQMWYDVKITAIAQFYAEKGTRYNKKKILQLKLGEKMSHEDFMGVMKFSFYSMSIVKCIICSSLEMLT